MALFSARVCKVPSVSDAEDGEFAWVSEARKEMNGQMITILGELFMVKVSKYLTAGDIGLNSKTRKRLLLSLDTAIEIHSVISE
jgi:hypothetical protein